MTQLSGFWTTSGSPVGHQVVSYDQILSSMANEIVGACHGKEGVAPSELNTLNAAIINSTTVMIATGRAMVDGKWYENDAGVNITIPLPAADSRIDRIVLRATWGSTFTVVLHRIAGTQSSSPTPPAITQTSGTMYDITLFQVLTNAGTGIDTITDERTWAQVQTAGIADLNVTADKIAANAVTTTKIINDAVDDTKLRNSAGVSVIGRSANTTGDPADIVAGADDRLLARVSNALSWVRLTLGMIPDLLITSIKLAPNSVITGKIANLNVTSDKLAADAVTTTKIADANVTPIKTSFFDSHSVDGALYSGRVLGSGAPSRLPLGWSSSKIDTGHYRITHNLGTGDYNLVCTTDTDLRFGSISVRFPAYIDIKTWSLVTGSASDSTFHFIIVVY